VESVVALWPLIDILPGKQIVVSIKLEGFFQNKIIFSDFRGFKPKKFRQTIRDFG